MTSRPSTLTSDDVREHTGRNSALSSDTDRPADPKPKKAAHRSHHKAKTNEPAAEDAEGT